MTGKDIGSMPPSVPAPCEEKMRLLAEYQSATEVYSKAVAALSHKLGEVPAAEHDDRRKTAQQARDNSADARKRFEDHILEHGC